MDKSNFIKIENTLHNVRNIKSITLYKNQAWDTRVFMISFFDDTVDIKIDERDEDQCTIFTMLLELYKDFETK